MRDKISALFNFLSRAIMIVWLVGFIVILFVSGVINGIFLFLGIILILGLITKFFYKNDYLIFPGLEIIGNLILFCFTVFVGLAVIAFILHLLNIN